MKQLFQYVVILHEYELTKTNDKVYKDSKIIIEPKLILAKTEKDVLFKVTREIPEEFASNPDDVQILIKNF
jgi:hypothetical protein